MILITDRFSMEQEVRLRTELSSKGHAVERLEKTKFEEQTARAVCLITRTKTRIDKKLLEMAPKLKFIVTVTSGFDHIDIRAARERGIEVRFVPQGNAYSAAEQTFALALACARRIPQADAAVRRGDWDREKLKGFEFFGKTWGIIGLGRIGRLVAERAKAFGMTVCAYDPYVDDEVFAKAGVERLSIIEVQRQSDILSLHVPLTQETHHMISLQALENFEEGSMVINTSRGEVIHERDLLEALERGYIGAAALDVFEQEPLSTGSALLKHPRVVVSPHCGGNTEEAFERGCLRAADRVLEFFRGTLTSEDDPFQEPWCQETICR